MAGTAEDQDYERLSPPTDLRKKVRQLSPREAKKFDPVAAAEAAVQRLSQNFGSWMENESQALIKAWDTIQAEGVNQENLDVLFHAAHNIRGQAQTLGFPLVGHAAANLCYLIEAAPTPADMPMKLTGNFVDAIRAMVKEGAKDADNPTGAELLNTLQTVTDAYLEKFPAKS